MPKHLKLPTLLVVSENPTVRFWTKKHLDEQFFIIAAEKKEEAIAALSARLDFIIVDDAMENGDPLELCKDLHALTQKQLVPILLITGKLKKTFRDSAKSFGVSDFLSDQLDPDELQTQIETGLKGASLRLKTEGLSQLIKGAALNTNTTLKHKVVLPAKAIKLFSLAKKENTETALLLIRLDSPNTPEAKRSLSTFFTNLLRANDALIPSYEDKLIVLFAKTAKEKAKLMTERVLTKIKTTLNIEMSTVIIALPSNEQYLQQKLEEANAIFLKHPEPNQILEFNA